MIQIWYLNILFLITYCYYGRFTYILFDTQDSTLIQQHINFNFWLLILLFFNFFHLNLRYLISSYFYGVIHKWRSLEVEGLGKLFFVKTLVNWKNVYVEGKCMGPNPFELPLHFSETIICSLIIQVSLQFAGNIKIWITKPKSLGPLFEFFLYGWLLNGTFFHFH